jgi:hypothetical protein
MHLEEDITSVFYTTIKKSKEGKSERHEEINTEIIAIITLRPLQLRGWYAYPAPGLSARVVTPSLTYLLDLLTRAGLCGDYASCFRTPSESIGRDRPCIGSASRSVAA